MLCVAGADPMTTPRKRAPGGGRKPTGNVRHTVSIPEARWQFIGTFAGDNRSARLDTALRRLEILELENRDNLLQF